MQILEHARACVDEVELMDPEIDDPSLVEAALKKARDAVILLSASTSTRDNAGPPVEPPEVRELHQGFIDTEREFNAVLAERAKANR